MTTENPPARIVADMKTAVDEAIREALGQISAAEMTVMDDGHVEIAFTLDVRVRGHARPDAGAERGFDAEPKFVDEAMGAACCRCVKYRNGSWICGGTCC